MGLVFFIFKKQQLEFWLELKEKKKKEYLPIS